MLEATPDFESFDSRVTRLLPDGTRQRVVTEGLVLALGMAVAPNGDLYVSQFSSFFGPGAGQVVRIPAPPACTVVGTSGDDVLHGTTRKDVICAGAGDDVIRGDRAGDVIYAGPGDDVVNGGQGRDRVFGGAGHDVLHGGTEGDWLHGGAGDDHLYGQKDQDRLRGGSGDDHLVGGHSQDVLHGNGGDDVLLGRIGHDHLDGGRGTDRCDGGQLRAGTWHPGGHLPRGPQR